MSLRRVLKGRFELGMFDPDERVTYSQIPYSVVESPEHVEKAREMDRKRMVVLKNADIRLRLHNYIQTIAVVGQNAAASTLSCVN